MFTQEKRPGHFQNGFVLLVIFAGLVVPAWAQTSVSGKVISEDNNAPMPGVNIVVKGTTNGTITNADGDFLLDVSSSDEVACFFREWEFVDPKFISSD